MTLDTLDILILVALDFGVAAGGVLLFLAIWRSMFKEDRSLSAPQTIHERQSGKVSVRPVVPD